MRDSTANDPRIGASLADGVHAVALPFLVTRLGVWIAGAIAVVVAGYTPIPGHASVAARRRSAAQFTPVMFPVFAWLAWRVRGRARARLIAACFAGQLVLAALFFTSHPIF